MFEFLCYIQRKLCFPMPASMIRFACPQWREGNGMDDGTVHVQVSIDRCPK